MNKIIYFYGYFTDITYHQFSNFHYSGFTEDDIDFEFVEKYMMYHKAKLMGDEIMAKLILLEKSPFRCKKLGRKVKPWNQQLWDDNKVKIVTKGVYLKFSQNEELKQLLLDTKDAILVEAAPRDKIWGIGISKKSALEGKPWNGQNLLGKILMDVRVQLT